MRIGALIGVSVLAMIALDARAQEQPVVEAGSWAPGLGSCDAFTNIESVGGALRLSIQTDSHMMVAAYVSGTTGDGFEVTDVTAERFPAIRFDSTQTTIWTFGHPRTSHRNYIAKVGIGDAPSSHAHVADVASCKAGLVFRVNTSHSGQPRATYYVGVILGQKAELPKFPSIGGWYIVR